MPERSDRELWLERYRSVRAQTIKLAEPLSVEDQVVQTIWFISPTKWHLAHTSWFFETFILRPHLPGYVPLSEEFNYLFNSYYNSVGEQFPQARRGMIARPGVAQVHAYRAHVDAAMSECLPGLSARDWEIVRGLLDVGLHHEQQHQELLVTDIKHVFAQNPLHPVYIDRAPTTPRPPEELRWRSFDEGVYEVGHHTTDFCFDNELPRHKTYIHGFELAHRPSTNAEFIAFMEDGGYSDPRHWLSDGWATVKQQEWEAPMYWERVDGRWHTMTLSGLLPVDPNEPVCHISYYEADAFATWAGARLPREHEWELAAVSSTQTSGDFLESARYHPSPSEAATTDFRALLGGVWEWTASPYTAYPGYRQAEGALGEYNGKFMCNTIVLRGGSCATPESHIRETYRNFFSPQTRWQFSGVRLAKDSSR